MGLTGDFERLAKLRFKVGMSRDLMREATEATREGVGAEYRADFAGSHSPWGDAWPARQDGQGGAPLQGPTGQLGGTDPTQAGYVVKMRPPKYWLYHQIGANGMHQRGVLPFGASKWDAPIQDKIERVIEDHFDGTGEG
jgi:hypothetical protein